MGIVESAATPNGLKLIFPTSFSLSSLRCFLGKPLDRSLTLPSTIQAAPGDEVVLVPPGVSRARVPLDGALVLQFLYGVVVALTVRPDAGAFRRLR